MSGRGDELAGRLRDRVVVLRQGAARDAIGGAAGGWIELGRYRAAVTIEGEQAIVEGEARSALALWRLTMRPCPIAIGDRIVHGAETMIVRAVRREPARPDRIVVIGEAVR